MTSLQVLNATMEKQEHEVDPPICLQILLNDKWHTVSVDRNDKNVLKSARVLVMMMLRSEIGRIPRGKLSVFTVRVRVEGIWEKIDIRAHSDLDARVMAYILKGYMPDNVGQDEVISLAQANTEIV